MRVFRLCNSDEIEKIIAYRDLKVIGENFKADPFKNNHQYIEGKRYMHFFEDETDLLYLSPNKGKNVCVYDIPEDILKGYKGYGNYADFINLETIQKIPEYAVPSNMLKLNYLKQIYLITEDMDFDYYPQKDEIYNCLSCMVDLTKPRNKTKDDDFER